MGLSLAVCLVSLLSLELASARTFCIKPEDTCTLARCDATGVPTLCDECCTLDSCLTKTLPPENSSLFFLSGNHTLNKTLLMQDMSKLSLIGQDVTVTILCQNAGFEFQSINGLNLSNLKLIKCGTKDFRFNNTASLMVVGGTDLNITNVTILEGTNAGIFSANVRGLTFISHLTVANTRADEHQNRGNEIIYVNSSHNLNYTLILQDSVFRENECFVLSKKNDKQIAGLTVYATSSAVICIQRTKFIRNCVNLKLTFKNITDISTLSVNITDSLVEGGNATTGGGVYVFVTKDANSRTPHFHSNVTQIFSSETVLDNVTFLGNVARYLGAAFYMQLKSSPERDMVYHNITLKNCIFTDNHLLGPNNGGVAIHINIFDIDGYLFQLSPQYKVRVVNCHFQNHSIAMQTVLGDTSGNSVLFLNAIDYVEFQNITVTRNRINAVTAVNSNLVFRGTTTISHNNGSSGGGLLLCQDATLYLTPHTSIEIFNNKARHAGGGICVEPHCIQTRPKCFFQIDNQTKYRPDLLSTIHIHLYNNTAVYGGHNLFGGDVDFCYMIDSPNLNTAPLSSLDVYHKVFNITSNKSSSVTSWPRHICFCKGKEKDCSIEVWHIQSYPGETITVQAVLVGQENGTVPGVVQTWANEEFMITGGVQNITHECSSLNYTVYIGQDSISFVRVNLSIGVHHEGDQSWYGRMRAFKTKRLKVKLKNCPIGFTLTSPDKNNPKLSCANCMLDYQDLVCEIKTRGKLIIRRKRLGDTWIGYEYTNNSDSLPSLIKHTVNCPFDYCIRDGVRLNMANERYDRSAICANNRTGIACGACREGYSALLGSSGCGKCGNNHLSFIVVFAVGGLALVVVLTLLNLTVSEGTLSGLIFYANVVEYNSAYVLPHGKHSTTFPIPILRVFIAWINLDLGIPTCFYDKMDSYAEAWLQFAFPLYIWSITILIILLSNRFQLVARLASRNAVKVLATLVLLSYATFLRAVISTFTYIDIHMMDSSLNNHTERAWLIDANVQYFGLKHTLLFVVASLCGLICLPFTLTLLFIKPLQRFSNRRPLRWLELLKPFLDAYTGPYTDNGRFWPGLLLLARMCLSITGGLNTLSSDQVVQRVTSLVIIMLLGTAGLVRPGLYRSRLLDALEYFFLLNLAILLLSNNYSEFVKTVVYATTVGLAFIVFSSIVLYHLWIKLRKRIYFNFKAFVGAHYGVTDGGNDNVHDRQVVNNMPPVILFNEEREPLLAD